MTSDLTELKRRLRREIRVRLRGMTPEQRAADSARLCARILDQPAWRKANAVFLYAPMPEEPDVWRLAEAALLAGKSVAVPRYNAATASYAAVRIRNPDRDLCPGQFGILEPLPGCPLFPMNLLDLFLVPGLAFDASGGRLGRGRGFYDRMLGSISGLKCGVAFDEQVVGLVPVGPHDVRMNCLITPTRWQCVEAE